MTRIWQSGDFWYFDLDGGVRAFDSEMEAGIVASKTKFVQALLVHATALSTAGAGLDDLREVYLDRDYGTTNLIGEEDVAPLGLTVAQVEALVAIIPGFLIYVNETTVREALNSARTDV